MLIMWYQWIGATGALLMITTTCMHTGMLSPYLAQFSAENSPLPLTLNEVSWIVSLAGPGRILGAILGSISVQYLGSKRTIVINSCLLLLIWIFLILANSEVWMYLASFVRGASTGIYCVSCPLYLGEIGSPAIRGKLVAYGMSGAPLGAMIGTILATYITLTNFAYVGLLVTFVCILTFLIVPESPHFLVRTEQSEKAKKSMVMYNPKVTVDLELESIKNFVTESNSVTLADRLKEFKNPRNRKGALIILLLYLFMHFSGLSTIAYYMEMILDNSMVTIIRPATVVIIANVLDVIAGWVSMYQADRFGRRMIWIISSGGGSVCLIGLGVNFSLMDNGYNSDAQQWLPIMSIIFYRIFLYMGICSVPSMYLSELIAPNIKTIVACSGNVAAGLFIFISTKSYQPLVDVIGQAYIFYMHGILLISAIIFGLKILPETSGKTLQEIQNK